MRLAILCQEEPVFLGPFLCSVIDAHPERVVAVCLAGRRSAGEEEGMAGLRVLWRVLEPRGFLEALALRLRARLLGTRDPRSVEGRAQAHGIAVHHVGDPNGEEFLQLLREVAPDAALNQSEKLLRKAVLSIPPLGFLNRHASLLPRCRGRMGAFWAHASEPPSYGLTIHQVDEGVDTGGIVRQRKFTDIDPAWPYPKVMKHIMRDSAALFWEAAEAVERPDFELLPNAPVDAPHRFPTLDEAIRYRAVLSQRRQSGRER